MMRRLLWVALAALATSAAGGPPEKPPAQASYAKRPDVRAFVREMVERHGFVEKELVFMFSRVKRQDAVLKAIQPPPPGQGPTWEAYRATFVNEKRIERGLAFWAENARALGRARADYGVPEEIIVAIIGVETYYGRNKGRWRVIDALSTLAFDYPPRAPFFRSELEHYLLLARQEGVNVFSMTGSYAGAIGIPQFMPGSWLRYAVDFDGDKAIDLRANPSDAIGSVGHFLQKHGWRAGEAVQIPASVAGEAWRKLAQGGLEARFSLEELKEAGVSAQVAAESRGLRFALVELESSGRPSDYRLAPANFYSLTRYNRSVLYATAVADLATALRTAK